MFTHTACVIIFLSKCLDALYTGATPPPQSSGPHASERWNLHRAFYFPSPLSIPPLSLALWMCLYTYILERCHYRRAAGHLRGPGRPGLGKGLVSMSQQGGGSKPAPDSAASESRRRTYLFLETAGSRRAAGGGASPSLLPRPSHLRLLSTPSRPRLRFLPGRSFRRTGTVSIPGGREPRRHAPARGRRRRWPQPSDSDGKATIRIAGQWSTAPHTSRCDRAGERVSGLMAVPARSMRRSGGRQAGEKGSERARPSSPTRFELWVGAWVFQYRNKRRTKSPALARA